MSPGEGIDSHKKYKKIYVNPAGEVPPQLSESCMEILQDVQSWSVKQQTPQGALGPELSTVA
jgi:hypothetical protein